jgi:hypothetical protein
MRSDRRPGPLVLVLALTLGACTSTKGEAEREREPEASPTPDSKPEPEPEPNPGPPPGPPVEFEPVDPPAPLTGPATTLSFDAEPPPMWFDKPVCHSRYARAETLDVDLPESVDVDVARVHALRAYSTHTLVWTPAASQHLVEAPPARARSRVRWRLAPDAPVELWVVDASPAPEDAERCWDVVMVAGPVEVESADGSFAITAWPSFLQLTPTSTRLVMSAPVEDFGLAYTPSTEALDPDIDLQLDLPVAEPRNTIPLRRDNRGLTPIKVRLDVTVDKTVTYDGRRRTFRGIEFLALSEESAEAREVLGEGTR